MNEFAAKDLGICITFQIKAVPARIGVLSTPALAAGSGNRVAPESSGYVSGIRAAIIRREMQIACSDTQSPE
jgi:hypothetical protein